MGSFGSKPSRECTGITVCERWSKFENFLADMGEKPPNLTIKQLNINKHYKPKNYT